MPHKTVIDWHPDPFRKQLDKHLEKNLNAAAIMLQGRIKKSFGSSGTRSKPWGPPNVDTGHLRRNIGWSKPAENKLTRRVGTGIGNTGSVGYAMWLEFGTRNMLPRPFLRPAMWKNRKRTRSILSRPMG